MTATGRHSRPHGKGPKMPLEIRKKPDGSLRPFWYGRYQANGKRQCPNLGVRIAGQPPASLSLTDVGDAAFERSRQSALEALARIADEAQSKAGATRLVEKLYELKTGVKIRTVPLAELTAEWARLPRRRTPDTRYAAQCSATLARFAAFVQENSPKADEIAHVTRETALAFMEAETGRGVTPKTWNDTLKLLRATFGHLLPPGVPNPFAGIPTRETETIFREPFKPEELKAIYDAARSDDFIRPIIVTGMCTAMRRGDCCLLQWKDVDLPGRFITVKTAKTGVTVSIPIFPMLYEELVSRQRSRGTAEDASEAYAFPDQARMYQENPDGITWRVRRALAAAGFTDDPAAGGPASVAVGVPTEEQKAKALAAIGAMACNVSRKERLRRVFLGYLAGGKTCSLAAAEGISKGSVSGDLNAIERASGVAFIRRKVRSTVEARGKVHAARTGGLRRASLRDFHSFRVTWVTLALTAGVPVEIVRRVTGHGTTDIVLKHYFQPDREQFRRALHAAMPQLLTNGHTTPLDEARTVLQAMTAETWARDLVRVLALLAAL